MLSPFISYLLSPFISYLLSPFIDYLLSLVINYLLSPVINYLLSPVINYLLSPVINYPHCVAQGRQGTRQSRRCTRWTTTPSCSGTCLSPARRTWSPWPCRPPASPSPYSTPLPWRPAASKSTSCTRTRSTCSTACT